MSEGSATREVNELEDEYMIENGRTCLLVGEREIRMPCTDCRGKLDQKNGSLLRASIVGTAVAYETAQIGGQAACRFVLLTMCW